MKKILLVIMALALAGCGGWLDDAKPKQFTEEEELFSRETGFKEALTGAYQMAAKLDLYGRRLTFDYIDKLGQRYKYRGSGGSEPFQQASFYDFSSDASETITNAIWEDMYYIIANLNNLLSWTEKNREVLVTPGYYEIIRGEALALRSFLYFDLVRMYGPVMLHAADGLSVPYRTEFNREARDLVPADEMLENIMGDLEEAYALLEEVDPLNFDYMGKLGAAPNEDGFLVFRQHRMNALATQALMARVALYAGDKIKAAECAETVIESGKFALNRNNAQDHIMSSEIIFGVNIERMQENVTDKIENYLTSEHVINDNTGVFFDALMNTLVDGANDNRTLGKGFISVGGTGTTYYYMTKFEQEGLEVSMRNMMPLIRLAEMYYIMTECTGDASWMNTVRDARAILPVADFADDAAMMDALGTEYRKEFYGEGQLWYFYKRTAATKAQFFNMTNVLPVDVELADRHYTFNVPDDEYLLGGLSEEE